MKVNSCSDHCWHLNHSPLLMVIPDGYIVQCCCKCHVNRTVHRSHCLNGKEQKSIWALKKSMRTEC